MTCKDCILYDECKALYEEEDYLAMYDADFCGFFKDKSRFIELPCKVGDKVKVKTCCERIYTTPVYEECRNECPFENDCEFDECNDSNEREFETEITSIFNEGSGWYVNVKKLCIEIPITEYGKTFQVIKEHENNA